MNKDSGSGFFSGLIVGAIVGAAIGLLYAPQTGQESRRVVREKAVEAKDRLAKVANRVKTAVKERSAAEAQ